MKVEVTQDWKFFINGKESKWVESAGVTIDGASKEVEVTLYIEKMATADLQFMLREVSMELERRNYK